MSRLLCSRLEAEKRENDDNGGNIGRCREEGTGRRVINKFMVLTAALVHRGKGGGGGGGGEGKKEGYI